jgi:LmbE family N-acetylglucosaminyl deacetylase
LAAYRAGEWVAATTALGVTERRMLSVPETLMCDDRSAAERRVLEAMLSMHREFADAGYLVTHHTVMGREDVHLETGASTLAHRVCERAARMFATAVTVAPVFLHAVYVYSHPVEKRTAPIVTVLSDEEMCAKRQAIDAYRERPGALGYGYRSVPELFDAAASDPREFMELV